MRAGRKLCTATSTRVQLYSSSSSYQVNGVELPTGCVECMPCPLYCSGCYGSQGHSTPRDGGLALPGRGLHAKEAEDSNLCMPRHIYTHAGHSVTNLSYVAPYDSAAIRYVRYCRSRGRKAQPAGAVLRPWLLGPLEESKTLMIPTATSCLKTLKILLEPRQKAHKYY